MARVTNRTTLRHRDATRNHRHMEDAIMTTHAATKRESGLDKLSDAIAERTDGKMLGEMTSEELAAAFSTGPIMFRNGEAVKR